MNVIKQRFIQSYSRIEKTADEPITCVLYQDEWLRILLEQNDEISNIEVEISLPEDIDYERGDSSEIFDKFTEFISYLKRLRKFGFEICVIEAGCIMTASKSLVQTPDDNLFRALLPP